MVFPLTNNCWFCGLWTWYVPMGWHAGFCQHLESSEGYDGSPSFLSLVLFLMVSQNNYLQSVFEEFSLQSHRYDPSPSIWLTIKTRRKSHCSSLQKAWCSRSHCHLWWQMDQNRRMLFFVTSMLALSICATFALTDPLNKVCATVWCHQTLSCKVCDSCQFHASCKQSGEFIPPSCTC